MWMKRLYWSWRDEAEHIVCACVWERLLSLWSRCVFFFPPLFGLVLKRLRNYTFYQNPHVIMHAAISLLHICCVSAGFEVVLYIIKWIGFKEWMRFSLYTIFCLIPSECFGFFSLWFQCSRFGSPVLGFPCRMIYLGCLWVFQKTTSQSLALMSFSFLIPLHLPVLALYCSRFCSNTLLKETDQSEDTAERSSSKIEWVSTRFSPCLHSVSTFVADCFSDWTQ